MNNKQALYEQISALADGELEVHERALLIKRLEQDPDARERWGRYHRIGELMRGSSVIPGQRVADSVRAALASEPAHGNRVSMPAWVRPLAGLAIAATVSAVAILALRNQGPVTDLSPVASAPALVEPDAEVSVRAAALRGDAAEEDRLRQRMEAYLVNYAESAAATRPQGVLEFVHVTRQGDLAQPGAEPAEATDARDAGADDGED